MTGELLVQLQQLNQQIDTAQKHLSELLNKNSNNQELLDSMQQQSDLQQSLNTIVEHAEKVERFGGSSLLWGEDCNAEQARKNRQRLTAIVQNHDKQLSLAQHLHTKLQDEIAELKPVIDALLAQKEILLEDISAQQDEYLIERKITRRTSATYTLPWSDQREDAIRLKAVMFIILCLASILAYLVATWDIPKQDQVEFIRIPERIARLLMEKAALSPPAAIKKKKPEEEIKPTETVDAKSTVEKEKVARKVAEKTGLLAFKTDFAEIMDVSSDFKLGKQAAIITKKSAGYRSNGGGNGGGNSGRSLVTSSINLTTADTLNTSVQRTEISNDNSLKKVAFSHIEGMINKETGSESISEARDQQQKRQSAKPARGDEEIQLVFDRYKDSLYRIYNRELRKKPLLRGKLVLRLTIEASGVVSSCIIDSSDLAAAELEKKIIARVLRFNFGEKPGAAALTILYPIDFLPAS